MLFLLTGLLSIIGQGALALAMSRHWQQLPPRLARRRCPQAPLRLIGALALAASLFLCLGEGRPGIGVLVWVMEGSAALVLVAAALATRPTPR